jgi:hypothetical protein
MSMKKLYIFCEAVARFLNKSVLDQVALRQGLSEVLLFPLLLLLLFSVFPPTLGIFLHVQADVGTPKRIYAVSDIGERQADRQIFHTLVFGRLTQCISLYEDKSVCVGAV